jgi:hypothetical protein
MNNHQKIARPFLRMMACVALIGGGEVKGVDSALSSGAVNPSVRDTVVVDRTPSDTGSAMATSTGTQAVSTSAAGLASTGTPASLANATPANASGTPNTATEKTETDAAAARDSAGAALAASSKDLTQLIQQVQQTPLTMTPRAASSMSPQTSPETGLRSPESSRSVDGNASAATLPSDEPLMPTPVDGPDGGELLEGEQDPVVPSADPIGTPKAPNKVVIPAFTQPIPEQQPAVDAAMKKPTLGCTDILMQSQCFIDPSIKVAYTYVYTLCLMEFSLQKYLESQQYMANNMRTLEEPAQASLKEIQRVLPSAILGYKLVSDLFQSGQLRDLLDNARQQYQDTKHLNP